MIPPERYPADLPLSLSNTFICLVLYFSHATSLFVIHQSLLLFYPLFSCFYLPMTHQVVPVTSNFLPFGCQIDDFRRLHSITP
jgi:hypothetical protein